MFPRNKWPRPGCANSNAVPAEARAERRRAEIRFYELRYQVERVLEGVSNREAVRILEAAVRLLG